MCLHTNDRLFHECLISGKNPIWHIKKFTSLATFIQLTLFNNFPQQIIMCQSTKHQCKVQRVIRCLCMLGLRVSCFITNELWKCLRFVIPVQLFGVLGVNVLLNLNINQNHLRTICILYNFSEIITGTQSNTYI